VQDDLDESKERSEQCVDAKGELSLIFR